MNFGNDEKNNDFENEEDDNNFGNEENNNDFGNDGDDNNFDNEENNNNGFGDNKETHNTQHTQSVTPFFLNPLVTLTQPAKIQI